jgi:hypothetical protein
MRTITALIVGLILGATGIASAARTSLIHFHDGQALVNKHIFCIAARGGITCSSDKDKGKPTYQATVIPDGMAVTRGNKTLFLHRYR